MKAVMKIVVAAASSRKRHSSGCRPARRRRLLFRRPQRCSDRRTATLLPRGALRLGSLSLRLFSS